MPTLFEAISPVIHPFDLARYMRAARMIEDDLHEAYFSCRETFGPEIAGALLVAELRRKFNDKPDQWPPPEEVNEKVQKFLEEKKLLMEVWG